MAFTDEDMNNWKGVTTSCENRGSIVCDDYSRINHRTLIALLARLEAAERYCETRIFRDRIAWKLSKGELTGKVKLKASGKEPNK